MNPVSHPCESCGAETASERTTLVIFDVTRFFPFADDGSVPITRFDRTRWYCRACESSAPPAVVEQVCLPTDELEALRRKIIGQASETKAEEFRRLRMAYEAFEKLGDAAVTVPGYDDVRFAYEDFLDKHRDLIQRALEQYEEK